MQPLDKAQRKQLEKAIEKARDQAEAAARAALEQLGVNQANKPAYLSEPDADLRRRLRAHGRQLGDSLNGAPAQTMDRLVEETAYQHWHRMLFARFLAENSLLMYDDLAITLADCHELAADEDLANGWELAARLAAGMLPQIFRVASPIFALALPPEHQQTLENLLTQLPPAVFTADDSLGWAYQFWQAKKKDDVNQSEVKIGARELPAVTQLFTEPYMVSFLLDNALGAWWAARRLTEQDLANAASEDELRQKAAIPGVPLTYLRFVREADNQPWQLAAGNFNNWPNNLAELTTLDPCCGSGHFLVAAFLMLVPLRMEAEGLPAQAACDAVLRDNLHGLELDPRCVELAAFALALTAWRYPHAGGYRPLSELHLACSGLSVSLARDEWRQLTTAMAQQAGSRQHNLSIALGALHDDFQHAPTLGSLINPAKGEAAKIADWQQLSTALNRVLEADAAQSHINQASHEQLQQTEAAVTAQGITKAASLLAGHYQWVITNVPYLARGKQSPTLADYCLRHHPKAKNDLATVFLDRCLQFATLPATVGEAAGREGSQQGTVSVVLPQNWLFLTSYKKFREQLLTTETWHLVARLGPGAFETISGEVVKAILITLSHGNPGHQPSGLFAKADTPQLLRGLDVSEPRTAAAKAAQLLTAEVKSVPQAQQLENPDARVAFDEELGKNLLETISYSFHGLTAGDMPRMKLCFWELTDWGSTWTPFQGTVKNVQEFGGNETLLRWENGQGAINELQGARKDGTGAWGKHGILVSQMRELPVTSYNNFAFDNNTAVIVPSDTSHLPAIWCFCSSPNYNEAVRRIDQKLNVTNATLVKVPFDLDHWTQVAEERYPHGLPQPYSDDPTQWIFHGHPAGSVVWDGTAKWTTEGELRTDATVLQVAVARLLGYRWPAELDADMELAAEQRAWVARCESLLPFADSDGIVCIPAVRGEARAEDRLTRLLAAAFGDAWSNALLAQLLKSADHAGKSLESWLRDKFFTQHCKLFKHRPLIWHIWDGLNDGFAALVNYHKLDHKTLETLIYTYLGDWITRQKHDQAQGIDGADEKLAAAVTLKKKLEQILKGEAPHDIFIRWKPIDQQPIGWHPDLNDGVRLNIRPFMTVADTKKKGAGILRDKPNIKWNKDRGTDVASAPWYHLGTEYGGKQGDRINDHHLTLADKQAARENGNG